MAPELPPRDEAREQRIGQLLSDATAEYERIAAWFDYLEQQLRFPFVARCISLAAHSPLRVGEQVEVVDLTDVDDWDDQVRVSLGGKRAGVDVPLAQLNSSDACDAATRQSVADWHYWVQRGYHFWTDDEDE
jgi:hypothetical protein